MEGWIKGWKEKINRCACGELGEAGGGRYDGVQNNTSRHPRSLVCARCSLSSPPAPFYLYYFSFSAPSCTSLHVFPLPEVTFASDIGLSLLPLPQKQPRCTTDQTGELKFRGKKKIYIYVYRTAKEGLVRSLE